MGKIAFVFPGQGSQYVGMAQEFYNNFPESKQVFDEAEEVTGLSMTDLVFNENDDLNITEYTQAAMLTASAAILKKVESMGIKPDVTAGLSLGQYASLVASGAMSFRDAVKVVRQRGILMQEAVPTGLGAMSAVLGTDIKLIEEICRGTEGIVSIANYNCPGQIVITGEAKAVEIAGSKLKEAGAKRVLPLNVSGPFHSIMLEEAGKKLGEVLDTVEIHTPVIPFVDNTTAEYIIEKDEIKDRLVKQVSSSVMWQQSVEKMIEMGVDTFIEMGPGKTISGFVKKIDKTCTTINIEKIEDLDKLQEVQYVRK